jgi:hypothetical protein
MGHSWGLVVIAFATTPLQFAVSSHDGEAVYLVPVTDA